MIDWPLRGEKTLLRPFCEADITDAYLCWLNDPLVTRYSNQRFRRHDAASCRAYLAGFSETPNLFLSIRRCVDEAAIGTMTAYRAMAHGTVDVGIMIGDPASWGQGFGQDAWTLLVDALLADPSIRKLTAGCAAPNRGMVRLMERSGLVLEATRTAQELIDDAPVDILLYARFADR